MEYIIGPIWILLELSAIVFFSHAFLQKRKANKKQILWFFAIWMISSIYSNIGISSIAILMLNLCAAFCLLTIFFSDKWLHRLLCTVVVLVFLSTIDAAVAYGFSAILGISYADFVWKKLLYIAVVTLGKLLEVLFAYLLWRMRNNEGAHSIKRKWTALTILFPAVSLAMLIAMFLNSQTGEDLPIGVFIFCCVLAIANVAILYLIRTMEKRSKDEQQLMLMNQQMEIQTKSIMSLEKSYRAQREASHEFNHKVETIARLLSQKDYSEAEAYLQQIQETVSVRTFAVNSHHPILDAVFNQKYQIACEQETDMQFVVNDLSAINIRTDELVVLFSNLLDNALEACARYDGERIIKCHIESTCSLYFSIRNTSCPVRIVDNQIETTKEPTSDHGFGLKSVCRILKELNAEYAFHYANGWFHFVAEMPLSSETK